MSIVAPIAGSVTTTTSTAPPITTTTSTAPPTPEGAIKGTKLDGNDDFGIFQMTFDLPEGSRPYDPEVAQHFGQIAGPAEKSANYGMPKQFIEVDRGDGREGILWQNWAGQREASDKYDRNIYMTWLKPNLATADTKLVLETT